MKISSIVNAITPKIRISVSGYLDIDPSVKLAHGATIISEGKCSVKIRNLSLAGGAIHSKNSFNQPIHHYADIRAGILKISKNRVNPFVLDGLQERTTTDGLRIQYPFEVPTGCVLMATQWSATQKGDGEE
jgi:hypothetical protein